MVTQMSDNLPQPIILSIGFRDPYTLPMFSVLAKDDPFISPLLKNLNIYANETSEVDRLPEPVSIVIRIPQLEEVHYMHTSNTVIEHGILGALVSRLKCLKLKWYSSVWPVWFEDITDDLFIIFKQFTCLTHLQLETQDGVNNQEGAGYAKTILKVLTKTRSESSSELLCPLLTEVHI